MDSIYIEPDSWEAAGHTLENIASDLDALRATAVTAADDILSIVESAFFSVFTAGARDLLNAFQSGMRSVSQELQRAGVALVTDAQIGRQMIAELERAISQEQAILPLSLSALLQQEAATSTVNRYLTSGKGMQGIAQLIFSQYGTSQPIMVTMLANGTLLVTVAGLEIDKWGQSNNLPNAIDAGLGDANNPYRQDVQAAIDAFMRAHGLPPGTKVIIAGHSYGGIVALELAHDNGKTDFTVTDVITFGSPQVDPQTPGVNYREYFDQYDPVPYLSVYKSGWLLPLMQISPAAAIAIAYGFYELATPQQKAAYLGETYIKNIGDDPGNPIGDHLAYPNNGSPSQPNPLASLALPPDLTNAGPAAVAQPYATLLAAPPDTGLNATPGTTIPGTIWDNVVQPGLHIACCDN